MKRNTGIALMQVVSALAIVNYHTSSLAIPALNHIAKFGFIFNTIFVYLSGYLLSQSLSAKPIPSIWTFLRRRANRIFPSLHVALLLISFIYFFTGHPFNLTSLLLTATGLAYYVSDNTFGLHLWFISVILVCYVICIPTYQAVKVHPRIFFLLLLCVITLVVFLREGSFNGIYGNVSNNIIYRFSYHYSVFSFSIYMGIRYPRHNYNIKARIWLAVFPFAFGIYLLTQPNPRFGIVTLFISIIVAICLIQIITSIPIPEPYSRHVVLASSVTLELYLIHYSVIGAVNDLYHGRYISFPLVFALSICLAVLIRGMARQYERLIISLTQMFRTG